MATWYGDMQVDVHDGIAFYRNLKLYRSASLREKRSRICRPDKRPIPAACFHLTDRSSSSPINSSESSIV